MAEPTTAVAVAAPRPSLMTLFASKYQIEPNKMAATLKATAFNSSTPVTDEQLAMLVIVANQYNLNPFVKQIYAFPDKGRIIPVVGVDGWIHLVQSHPQFDGWEFDFDPQEGAMTCTIHRKDRRVPTQVTEYLTECRRETDPWKRMPRRMLRNRAIAQAARLAFGFSGIHTDDEAETILESNKLAPNPEPPTSVAARVKRAVKREPIQPVEEVFPLSGEDAQDESGEDGQTWPSALPQWRARLLACGTAAAAADVLRESLAVLNADEQEALTSVFRAEFQPTKEKDE